MRFAMWLVPLLLTAAFVAGRLTSADAASASPNARVYTGRQGDVFRVPSTATRCLVSVEGGSPRLYCSRIGGGRYTVDFYKTTVQVWRNGNPDNPAFSARWKP
jgi:hypothetical protein